MTSDKPLHDDELYFSGHWRRVRGNGALWHLPVFYIANRALACLYGHLISEYCRMRLDGCVAAFIHLHPECQTPYVLP